MNATHAWTLLCQVCPSLLRKCIGRGPTSPMSFMILNVNKSHKAGKWYKTVFRDGLVQVWNRVWPWRKHAGEATSLRASNTVKEARGWVMRNALFFLERWGFWWECSMQTMQQSGRVPLPLFVLPFPLPSKQLKRSFSPFKRTQRQTARRCMTSQSSYTCQENSWPKGQAQGTGDTIWRSQHSAGSALKSSDLWQVTKHHGAWFFNFFFLLSF